MTLEVANHISGLNPSNPDGATTQVREVDDHIRLIKQALKNSFPQITGPMQATQNELNKLSGCTTTTAELNKLSGLLSSAAELNVLQGLVAKASNGTRLDNFPAGTIMLFQQTTAPLGWTKQTDLNNMALRVVSGAAGNGGSAPFTTVFGAGKVTASHTLTLTEIPAHTHSLGLSNNGTASSAMARCAGDTSASTSELTSSSGSGGGHSHGLSLDLQYVDVIRAVKA